MAANAYEAELAADELRRAAERMDQEAFERQMLALEEAEMQRVDRFCARRVVLTRLNPTENASG